MFDWGRFANLRAAFLAALLLAASAGVASAGPPPGDVARPEPRWHVPVLMYHRIVPLAEARLDQTAMAIAPEAFSRQLSALDGAGWHTITLARLAEYLRAGRTPPARTFVITIDDGREDGFRYALPILRAHDFVGTFFVITGRIGHPGYLAARHLLALQTAGNEIGNHTVGHVPMAKMTRRQSRAEVTPASETIQKILGRRPVSFAYPMGADSANAAAEVAACRGLEIGVTTKPGLVTDLTDRFREPRLEVGPATTTAALLARMTGAGDLFGPPGR